MSHALKLSRADAHIETLYKSFQRWKEANPNPIIREPFDPQTGEYVYRLKFSVPYDLAWPVIVGDALFSLRATLDYLIFAMSVKAVNRPLTEAEARACQFPIRCKTKPLTPEIIKKDLKLVPSAAIDIIKSLQPDQITNDLGHPLWALCVLNNWDKHRSLHIVASSVKSFAVKGQGGIKVLSYSQPPSFLDDGDIVSSVKVTTRQGKGEKSLSYDCVMMPCIKEAPAPQFTLYGGLADIRSYIDREVITPLSRFL